MRREMPAVTASSPMPKPTEGQRESLPAVSPPGGVGRADDWAKRIEIAKRARIEALRVRADKPATFASHVVTSPRHG
jgi:hypothetical protein